jgi:hypothetical protein
MLNGETKAYLTLLSSKTGDQLQVNKGFLSNLLDDDDNSGLNSKSEENKYQFLSEEMGADDGEDFYDPAALLRRQKILLQKIEDKSKGDFSPLKVLSQASGIKYMVILCHGGKFALQYFESAKLISSRSESKYVSRGKQGGRQLNKDKHAKVMNSTGS